MEIKIGETNLIIVNCYMPPQGARQTQTDELSKVLLSLKNDFASHQIMISMQNLSIENENALTSHEKRLFNLFASFGLVQQFARTHANSRNSHLDLVFTSIMPHSLENVPQHCLLDSNSAYHNTYSMQLTLLDSTTKETDIVTTSLDFIPPS